MHVMGTYRGYKIITHHGEKSIRINGQTHRSTDVRELKNIIDENLEHMDGKEHQENQEKHDSK